jgi:hypothetical protein
MAHTIRTNSDHSEFQIALESNTLSEVCDAREEMTFVQDENGDIYLASFGHLRQDDDILEPETLYLLKPVSALVEEVDEFETEDGDEEEEEEEEDDDGEETT